MDQILSNTQQEEICLVLLGNKCDMEPKTITGHGIKEAFESLTRDIMKKRGVGESNNNGGGMSLNKKKNKKDKKDDCCKK